MKRKRVIISAVLGGVLLVGGGAFIKQNLYVSESLKEVTAGAMYPIYTEKEREADPTKESATIQYFPAGDHSRFVVICPGGAYEYISYNETEPIATAFNAEGITAFVLRYRVGLDLTNQNTNVYDDVGYCIQFIMDHAKAFNIDKEHYAISGYSAGGHLATTFAADSAVGYLQYDIPKPECVITGYAAYNFANTGIAQDWLLPKEHTSEQAAGIKPFQCLTSDYPPIYMVQGTSDTIVPYQMNAEIMDRRLDELGVVHHLELYEGMQHGFGVGTGTAADGWIRDAVAFWLQQTENQS